MASKTFPFRVWVELWQIASTVSASIAESPPEPHEVLVILRTVFAPYATPK